MPISPVRRLRRHRPLVATAILALAVAMIPAVTPSASALPSNIFELDANVADPAGGGDDWATLYADATLPAGGSTAFTGIIPDSLGQTIFAGGGSKDDLDVPGNWMHSAGSVPDKDEITNAYAAAYLAPDGSDPGSDSDLLLYFGSDRLAQNGSANVGFWFTKEKIGPVAAGAFSGKHAIGDTLVLSEFTNGGAVSTIQVWKWDPTGTAPACPSSVTNANVGCRDNGVLILLLASASADCDTAPATANACANVNGSDLVVPWPYKAKSNAPAGTVPKGGFIEGGINISALSGGARPCLSNFLAETRSSPSLDAVLKDFVRGDFPLCGANVQIAGSAINEVGDPHTFTVTANEVFGGSAAPSDDAHVDVTLTGANGANPVVNAAASTCDNAGVNVNAAGQCTVVFSSATPGTVSGSATAQIPVAGSETFTVTTNGLAGNSSTVLKRFVDARITLSPLTDTNGITENHVVTADVEVNLGDGAGWVAATDGHVDVTTTPSGGASVTPNPGGTTCHVSAPDPLGADNLDGSGQCTVAFTSNTAGTVTVGATVNLSVTVDGFTEEITRSTNGSGGNSVEATKDFVDGTLRWLKTDDQGAPLGGASFWVCRTHAWNSATASFDAIADTNPGAGKDNDSRCIVVLDNSAPDADSDAGELQLNDLLLGRYTVQEKAAPLGYALDPDTETADLAIDDPNTPANETAGDAGTFVDPALYKVIVLTCNTSTETLVDSTVDLDPGTAGGEKETLTSAPGGLTEAQLCGLGGASYDNLTTADYDLQVELPDQAPLFP